MPAVRSQCSSHTDQLEQLVTTITNIHHSQDTPGIVGAGFIGQRCPVFMEREGCVCFFHSM